MNPTNTKKSLQREFESILCRIQEGISQKGLEEGSGSSEAKERFIHKIIQQVSSEENRQRIWSEFSGLGPLESLLSREEINEIIIDGKDHIHYELDGHLHCLNDGFLSKVTFHNAVEKISAEAGISVNRKKPFREGRWRNFRAHLLCPPVVKEDFHLCLRKHPKQFWTLKRLKEKNWAPEFAIKILKDFIKDRLNFLIVGGTGTGKTSTLNACLQELGPRERVLSIEDTDEITLPNKAGIKLLSQSDPENLKALIDQQILLRQSLRLRPDRIVMGEVRGEEAKDLLLALSSGHRGSIGTIHGDNHRQAIWKLETLSQMASPQWQSHTVRQLIFYGLGGVVVLEKRDGMRLLKGIYRISSLEPSGFLFDPLYERDPPN